MSVERDALKVEIARGIDSLMQVTAVRAIVYGSEQKCPLSEEFDGNDFAGATHLLASRGQEPVGTLRLRWFGDFAKVERVAIVPGARDGAAARLLIDAAVELAARKNYRLLLGHVESTLVRYWKCMLGVTVREHRPRLHFSDRDYVEIVLVIRPTADAITSDADPMVMLRPEGDWDRPGVLDRSARRTPMSDAAWTR